MWVGIRLILDMFMARPDRRMRMSGKTKCLPMLMMRRVWTLHLLLGLDCLTSRAWRVCLLAMGWALGDGGGVVRIRRGGGLLRQSNRYIHRDLMARSWVQWALVWLLEQLGALGSMLQGGLCGRRAWRHLS